MPDHAAVTGLFGHREGTVQQWPPYGRLPLPFMQVEQFTEGEAEFRRWWYLFEPAHRFLDQRQRPIRVGHSR